MVLENRVLSDEPVHASRVKAQLPIKIVMSDCESFTGFLVSIGCSIAQNREL